MQQIAGLGASEQQNRLKEIRVEFEQYVAARGPALVRLAFLLTRDAHLAEDLTQAALIDAYRHWKKVTRADHPDAYVRRILVNTHLSWARRRSHGERPSDGALDPPPSADHADGVAGADHFRTIVDELPPRARTVLVLRYYADLDDAAIADLMQLRPSAVRATASRALATLRERAGILPDSNLEGTR
jgi:RNA polymerase sigma-70 factor (sigma-E family)